MIFIDNTSDSNKTKQYMIEWIDDYQIRIPGLNLQGFVEMGSDEINFSNGELWKRVGPQPFSTVNVNSALDTSISRSASPNMKAVSHYPSESWTNDMLGMLDELSRDRRILPH